jgi:hypothetical protein
VPIRYGKMKTLLITDRHSDSSRISLMKIGKIVKKDKSTKLDVIEIMPWIRVKLQFDEEILDTQSLINQLRAQKFVAAEI